MFMSYHLSKASVWDKLELAFLHLWSLKCEYFGRICMCLIAPTEIWLEDLTFDCSKVSFSNKSSANASKHATIMRAPEL